MIPYALSSGDGTVKLTLNHTFFIAEHDSQFNWGIAATPRTHGDRAIDKAYLNGKAIELRGFVSAGRAGGSLPYGWTLTTPANGLLSAGINAVDTTIPLDSAAGFATIGRALVGTEVIYYTGKSGNSLVNAQRGADGSTAASHGTFTTVIAPTEQAQYLDQLRAIFEHLHTYQRGILDYRNGWIQYVLFTGIKSGQVEGWPDVRAVSVQLRCEDPLAYAIVKLTATRSTNMLSVVVSGNSPTTNYRLSLRSATSSERLVKVIHTNTGTIMRVLLPKVTDPELVLNGWQRVLYQGTLTNRAWNRFRAGGTLPTLVPGNNVIAVRDAATDAPINLTTLASTSSPVQAELTAHSADWMADSFRAPGALPPGAYDIATYDVDVYS